MNIKYIHAYAKNNPITTVLVMINIFIFLLNRLFFSTPIVSSPGVIDVSAVLANFSHYALLHFGFNTMILWQISPMIEARFNRISYVGIILAMTALITIGVSQFSQYPTLGFSGIGLGMMVLAGLMYRKNKAVSKELLGWAGVNIVLGLMPGISFAGHFIGAVVGALIFGVLYLVKKKSV